ncbi:MAG: zf-HC2 domain-containing protein [Chloroflexi bacterium]|nr:zf-HC2 domain-containing protein [Chloroflexota bacterium]
MIDFSPKKRDSDCHDISELLSAHIDGQVTQGERERVQRHLDSCASCTEELRSMQETVQLLHELAPVRVPRSFMISAVAPTGQFPRGMASRPKRYAPLFFYLRNATAALAAALIVVFVGSLYLQSSAPGVYKAVPQQSGAASVAQDSSSGQLSTDSPGVQAESKGGAAPAAKETGPKPESPATAPRAAAPKPPSAATAPAPAAAPQVLSAARESGEKGAETKQVEQKASEEKPGEPRPAAEDTSTKQTAPGLAAEPIAPPGKTLLLPEETVEKQGTPGFWEAMPLPSPFREVVWIGLGMLAALGMATLGAWLREKR